MKKMKILTALLLAMILTVPSVLSGAEHLSSQPFYYVDDSALQTWFGKYSPNVTMGRISWGWTLGLVQDNLNMTCSLSEDRTAVKSIDIYCPQEGMGNMAFLLNEICTAAGDSLTEADRAMIDADEYECVSSGGRVTIDVFYGSIYIRFTDSAYYMATGTLYETLGRAGYRAEYMAVSGSTGMDGDDERYLVGITLNEEGMLDQLSLWYTGSDDNESSAFFTDAAEFLTAGEGQQQLKAFIAENKLSSLEEFDYNYLSIPELDIMLDSWGDSISLDFLTHGAPDDAVGFLGGQRFAKTDLTRITASAAPSDEPPETEPVPAAPAIELFNANGITITTAGKIREESFGFSDRYILPVVITNQTGIETDLLLDSKQVVNGRLVSGPAHISLYESLSPGDTKETEIYFECGELEQAGVSSLNQLASLEAGLRGVDQSTYVPFEIGKLSLSAVLLGLEQEEAPPAPYADELEPRVLIEKDGLTVRLNGLSVDGQALDLTLENSTDEKATVIFDEIVVNGWQLSASSYISTEARSSRRELIYLAKSMEDFSGYAELSFDLSLQTGDNIQTRVRPVEGGNTRVSLTPANPAEAKAIPDGWILAAEQGGVRILYKNEITETGTSLHVPLLIDNGTDRLVRLRDEDQPPRQTQGCTLTVNGKTIKTYGFFDGGFRTYPRAHVEATLYISKEKLAENGIQPGDVRTFDFSLALFPNPDSDLYSNDYTRVPVHIDLQ